MFILDGHLDLSMNALEWNRDLTQPLQLLRDRESHLTDKNDRGNGTVCFPEMRRGEVGVCVATQIAGCVKRECPVPGWKSPEQAWAQTQGQLAWYQAMEDRGELKQLRTADSLKSHVSLWQDKTLSERETLPIGYVLSLEGADSLITLDHLEKAVENGLRALGPAHYGPGRYANGTEASGGFPKGGRDLLKKMDELGLILDVTHLTDECFDEALEWFKGPIWASHSNCRKFVPHQRQLSDVQIKRLVERNAVIGIVLDAWMMHPNWERWKTIPQDVNLKLESLVEHIDHVSQLAGNSSHSAIGSDLDGGFGTEQTAGDLNSIVDLQQLNPLLKLRGYQDEDIKKIFHGNSLTFLGNALP
jgi:membrane dipeptidase